MLTITSLFAALLAPMFVFLSVRVIKLRQRYGASVGDAGASTLQMAIRAHGNFAEYVPLFLILLALAEMAGVMGLLLWGVGGVFAVGRISHAYGLSVAEQYENGKLVAGLKFRVGGMICTFTCLLILAICLLWQLVSALGVS